MRSLTTRLVVDPLLRSSPVHDWLSEQLEQCGFDGHYASRCVLSIATRECTDDEPKISSCFDVQPGGDFDVVRKSPVSPLAGSGGAQDSVQWNRKTRNCEEWKKLQIMDWLRLMLSTEEWRTHQLTVKQLVTELFNKLHQQRKPTDDVESSETSPVGETAQEPGSDSLQDVAARYYAAFPSLSDKCDLLANKSLLSFDAQWSRVAQTQPKTRKIPDTGITDGDSSGSSSSAPLVNNAGNSGGCRRHSCTKPSGFVPPARRSSQKSSRSDSSRRSRPSRSSRSHRSSHRSAEHNRWPTTAPFIYLPVPWMNVAPGGFNDPTWCPHYAVAPTDEPAVAGDENEIHESDDENSPSSYKDRFVNLKSCFWGKPSFEDAQSAFGNGTFSDECYRRALVPCIVTSESSAAEPQNERLPLSTLFGTHRAFDRPPPPSNPSSLETRTTWQQSFNTLGNSMLPVSNVSSSCAAVVSVGNKQLSEVDTLWSTLAPSSFDDIDDDDDDDDPLLGCRPLDPELWFILNSERMNIAGILSSDTPFHLDWPLDDYCFPLRAMHALPCFGNLRQLEWNVLDNVETADLCENILSSGALPPWLMSLTDDLQNEQSSFCTENGGVRVMHTGFVSPGCAAATIGNTMCDCSGGRKSPASSSEDGGEVWDGCLIAEAMQGSSGQESSMDPDAIRRIWKPKRDDPIPETVHDEEKFCLPAVGPWTQCPEPWSTWSSGGIPAVNSTCRAPANDRSDISEVNAAISSCSISQNNSNSNIVSLVRCESVSDDRHFTNRVIYKDDAAHCSNIFPDECLNEFCESSFAGESPLPFSFCSSADIDLLLGESLDFRHGFESANNDDRASSVECLNVVDAAAEFIPKVDQQKSLESLGEGVPLQTGWQSRLFPADAVATIGELPCGDGEHCCGGTVSNLTLDNVRQLFASCSSTQAAAAVAAMVMPTCSVKTEYTDSFTATTPLGLCEENNNLLCVRNSSACCVSAAEFTATKSSSLHVETDVGPPLLPDLPSVSDICFSDMSSDVESSCTFSSGSGGSVFCSPEPRDFLSSSAMASAAVTAMTDPAVVDFSVQVGNTVPSLPLIPVNDCAFEPDQLVGYPSISSTTTSVAGPFYSVVGSSSSMWFRDAQFVMSSFDALSRIAPQQIHSRPFFGAWPSPSCLSHQSVCSAIARCGRLFPSENSAFRDDIPQRISSDSSSLLHTLVCCSSSDSFFPRWLPPAAAQPLEIKITPTHHQFRPIGTPSLSDTDSDCCSSVSCVSPSAPNNSEIISNIVTSVSFSREAVGATHFDSDAVYQQFIADGNMADEEADVGTVGIRSFRPSFKVRCELEKSAQTGDASPELRQMSDGDAERSTSRLVSQVLRQLSNEFPATVAATGSTASLPGTFTADSLPDSAFAELLTSQDNSVASLSRRLSRIWNQTSDDNSWSSDSRGVAGSDKDVVLGHLADIWSNDPPLTLTVSGSVNASCSVIDGLPSSGRISEIWKDEPDLVVNDLEPVSPDNWEDGPCDQCDGDKDDMVSSSCSLLHVWSSAHDFCACETGELVPSHLAEIWSDVRQPPDGEESVERSGETDEAHVISRIWSQTSLDHKARVSPSAVEAEKLSDVDANVLDEQQPATIENVSLMNSSASLPQFVLGRPEPAGNMSLPYDLSNRTADGCQDTTDAVEATKKFIGGIGGSLFGSNRVWSLDGPEPASDEGKEPDARLKAIWDKPICSERLAVRSFQDGAVGVVSETTPGNNAASLDDPGYVAAAAGTENVDEMQLAAGTEAEVSPSCEVDLMLNLVSGILEMMSQSCAVTGCNSVVTKSISEPVSSSSAATVLGWPETFMRRGSLETFLPMESTASCLRGQLTDIAANPMSFPQCFSAEWPMTYSKGCGGFHAMSASELTQSVGQRAGTVATAGKTTMPTGRWSLSSQRDYSELLEALSCEQLQGRSTLGGALYAFMSPGLGGGSSDTADVGILAVAPSTGGSMSAQSGSTPVIVPRRLETVHKTTTMTPINLWS